MKILRLSYSAWDTYQTCGYKYYLKFIKHIKPPVPIRYPLVTGLAFHELVNAMYKERKFDRSFLTKNWKVYFLNELEKEGSMFSSTEDSEKYLKYGYGLISKFYKFAEKEGYLVEPIETEWAFKIPNNGTEIVGKVDLIIERKNADFKEVLDFKTGWKLPSVDYVDISHQLTIYDWAVKLLLGLTNLKVSLFYPRQATVLYGSRTEDQHKEMLKGLNEFASKVQAQIFDPNFTHCLKCEFKDYCDRYKNKDSTLSL